MWLMEQEKQREETERILAEHIFLAGKYGIIPYIDENLCHRVICVPSNYKLLLVL